MRLAYVTLFDATDVRNWSGTDLHIWKALEAQGVQIELIGDLRHGRAWRRRLRKWWGRRVERRGFLHFWDADTAADYAGDVARRLAPLRVDAVLSPSPIPLAYLECSQPKYLWTDAIYSALSKTHWEFSPNRVCSASYRHARAVDCAVARNCRRLIFASEWGAEWAIRDSGADPAKVEVVPFGANVDVGHAVPDVLQFVDDRGCDPIRLLFVGVDWVNKGAAKAVRVTSDLRGRGINAELAIVGCWPPHGANLPSYVTLEGFVSKATAGGRERLARLYEAAHFLIVPTAADAFGLVFAEACAYGVPSLSHSTGGVPTVVRDGVNGKLFSFDEPVSAWVDWIMANRHPDRLRDLAAAAFAEYETRLNWSVAGERVAALIGVRPRPATRVPGPSAEAMCH